MKVMAFDPGGSTGFKQFTKTEMFTGIQFTNKYHHLDLWNCIVNGQPDVLVYETFQYRNQSRAGLVPPGFQRIHWVIQLYDIWNSAPVVSQSPSQAKGFVKDQTLKEAGIYVLGLSANENDAARHLLFYLCTENHKWPDVKNSYFSCYISKQNGAPLCLPQRGPRLVFFTFSSTGR